MEVCISRLKEITSQRYDWNSSKHYTDWHVCVNKQFPS